MHIFAQAFPERFFQLGMAEQLLLGAAAGFAEAGLIPFASTYSVFATRRAYDFLCLDAAEPGLNVNVVGGLPGLTTGYGPSHQATEDVAIFRGIPGLTIVDPCDSVDIEQAVPQLAATPGPTYLRLLRGKVPTVLDEYDYTFELGKAKILRPGRDVVLVSSGLMTMRALQAAERLAGHHVDVSVVHSPTLKPFDAATVLAEIDTDRLALTCENHTIVGGLFETTAAAAARAGLGRRIEPIALPDQFLDAGALPDPARPLRPGHRPDRRTRPAAGRFLTLPHWRGGALPYGCQQIVVDGAPPEPETSYDRHHRHLAHRSHQDQPARAGAGFAADRHHQRADPARDRRWSRPSCPISSASAAAPSAKPCGSCSKKACWWPSPEDASSSDGSDPRRSVTSSLSAPPSKPSPPAAGGQRGCGHRSSPSFERCSPSWTRPSARATWSSASSPTSPSTVPCAG